MEYMVIYGLDKIKTLDAHGPGHPTDEAYPGTDRHRPDVARPVRVLGQAGAPEDRARQCEVARIHVQEIPDLRRADSPGGRPEAPLSVRSTPPPRSQSPKPPSGSPFDPPQYPLHYHLDHPTRLER